MGRGERRDEIPGLPGHIQDRDVFAGSDNFRQELYEFGPEGRQVLLLQSTGIPFGGAHEGVRQLFCGGVFKTVDNNYSAWIVNICPILLNIYPNLFCLL